MSRNITKDELMRHKQNALNRLDDYLTSLIENQDAKIQSKSDKLSYWIEDWATFLRFESQFSPSSLRRYKRGEIVKAHLGYNIGSEEGGLHYCVVIDKNNSRNSPIVTVVPLTSVKPNTDTSKLHKGSVFLGNELFVNLNSKFTQARKNLLVRIENLEEKNKCLIETPGPHDELKEILNELTLCEKELGICQKLEKEIRKMKHGSIALVSQIRTISKIRIYDPKTNFDILSNIKFSNEKLDLIDKEILKNFTK